MGRSLITQTIRNLIAGVSQQPAQLRYPEQLEEQINGWSSDGFGLQKRPPTCHIASLYTKTDNTKPLVHFYKRDEAEQYCLIFNGAGVDIYDLQGNKKTVKYEGSSKSYITTNTPRKVLRCVTIADYTFILNIKKVAKMSTSTSTNFYAQQGALINVKAGQYGRTYKVLINGDEKASFTTPDGSKSEHVTQIDTNYIATKLADGLKDTYNVTQGESWLHVKTKGDNVVNTVETKDGYNNQAIRSFLKVAQKFTDLPATAPNNFVVKVKGDVASSADDYYVQYNSTEKVWKECVEPALNNTFDNTTLPQALIRNADGSFTLKAIDWAKREAGDEDSNPEPSFIGNTINDIFFFRNRLGFIAGENVILTKAAEFFDFWMDTATDVLDTDPVDTAVSDNRIATLNYAIPFKEDLLLFSDNAQFVLSADGALSPKNHILNVSTNFTSSVDCKPVGAGKNVYFTAKRALKTTVREYFTALDDTSTKDAQDITAHVANYIPNTVYQMVSSNTENVIMLLSDGAESSLYVYKYLYLDSVKKQSAWSRWDFNAPILGAGFIESTLYLIVLRNQKICLEKITFTYNTLDYPNEPYRVHCDRKVTMTVPSNAYDSTDNLTTINLAENYELALDKEHGIVTSDGTFRRSAKGETTVTLHGNYAGQTVTLGQLYKMCYTMSPIYIKHRGADGSITAEVNGRLQLRYFWLNYTESSYFKLLVNNYKYDMTGRVLDSEVTVLDELIDVSGTLKVPVQTQNTNCTISIESDTPGAVTLTGAGWEGLYYTRSSNI